MHRGVRVAVSVAAVSSFHATSSCDKGRAQHGLECAVGNTPLIYLQSLSKATGCHIFGKAEWQNPSGSVKDRAALSILEAAETNGSLLPGGTIVEGTIFKIFLFSLTKPLRF